MRYFVYVRDSNGNSMLECFGRDDLTKKLDENWWGDLKCLSHIPGRSETGIFIIAGTNILPEPIKVVEKWRLP